jgi:hypothetical protein
LAVFDETVRKGLLLVVNLKKTCFNLVKLKQLFMQGVIEKKIRNYKPILEIFQKRRDTA